jgi:hypothetical protein
MAIWNILGTFGIFYGTLVHVTFVNLVHFSGFGIMYQEKSGNPEPSLSIPASKSTKGRSPMCCLISNTLFFIRNVGEVEPIRFQISSIQCNRAIFSERL